MTTEGAPVNDPGAQETPAPDRTAFLAAYGRLLDRWPHPHETITIASDFGTTSVIASGPVDAPPVLLIHAYQATSAEWIELARALSTERRVFAVDVNGDAGHSSTGTRPISTPADMVEWLDTVMDGLRLTSTELCGHSYGAWIALAYAIERPTRVSRVTLLDPTMSFAPLFPAYVLRALPALFKPTAARRTSLIRWESKKGKATLDPEWLQVTGMGADVFGDAPTVPTKIPKTVTLMGLRPPALVIIAGSTKVHAKRRVARKAGQRLPNAKVETVRGASHYGLPMTHAHEVAALMLAPPVKAQPG
jgi:pimeloyl-ACP methyl ester carboxylesterase